MWASNVAERVELDSLFESKWEMSGFVNYIVRIAANSGGRRTMIGVFMFWKRLLFDGVGSSIDGLLDDEPILKGLAWLWTFQGRLRLITGWDAPTR